MYVISVAGSVVLEIISSTSSVVPSSMICTLKQKVCLLNNFWTQ